MFVAVRAITYASVFIGLVLIYVPALLLGQAGRGEHGANATASIIGIALGAIGAVIVLWCISTFIVVGRGTPAPFDPPQRLVDRGPYRWVRNPMYIGAALVLAGAAATYESLAILAYMMVFLVVTHALVVVYEEPILRGAFGADYIAYCGRTGRWWPKRHQP